MRKIEFRGKRLDNGEWVYGSLVINNNLAYIYNGHSCPSEVNFEYDFIPVNPATVGQYTGLKDKDSEEIYEGDIVNYYKCDGKTRRGFIKYHEDGFDVFRAISCFDDCSLRGLGPLGIVVIGNIHDNPELLQTE